MTYPRARRTRKAKSGEQRTLTPDLPCALYDCRPSELAAEVGEVLDCRSNFFEGVGRKVAVLSYLYRFCVRVHVVTRMGKGNAGGGRGRWRS